MENFVLTHDEKSVYFQTQELAGKIHFYYYLEGAESPFGSLDQFASDDYVARTKGHTKHYGQDYDHIQVVEWFLSVGDPCIHHGKSCC